MNDFDTWNELKKAIDVRTDRKGFVKEGDVWMCILGKNVGFEQNGTGQSHFQLCKRN
jgi:hypothetical protein